MPNLALPGHPVSLANRIFGVYDHTGPSSYTTGGEVVPASDFSMSALDFVVPSQLSLSGTYVVYVLYPLLGTLNVGSVNIAWYVTSTGLQVSPGTDLSGEHIHLMAVGV